MLKDALDISNFYPIEADNSVVPYNVRYYIDTTEVSFFLTAEVAHKTELSVSCAMQDKGLEHDKLWLTEFPPSE